MFPPDLGREAFRADNGELAWKRENLPLVVEILSKKNQAILGGELWWIPQGTRSWTGIIPDGGCGPDGVYHWETKRLPEETWADFVRRCAVECLATTQRWPSPEKLESYLHGQILYNLDWVSSSEYDALCERAAKMKANPLPVQRSWETKPRT